MARPARVLLVDDEEGILRSLARALSEDGHDVVKSTRGREAQRLLAERDFDLLIIDNRMPDRTGLEVIRELMAATDDAERPEILMMTAHASIENAIEAMRLGAFDYLQKPFEIEALLAVARRALEHHRLRTQNRYLLNERSEEFGNYGIVGASRAVREMTEKLELVARSRSTVLIQGETGTGKELAARFVHDRSAQRDMPLVKVNCAAIPETLIESELFGHVRGAFTGATTSKKGKFALADGGTILLDEVGSLSSALQPKLLRVLQEREFEPLGAERTESVDVRVIAATNRDLGAMVASGRFEEDLFYRLSVIPITIPPLRERPEDLPALVEHFVAKHARRTGRDVDSRVDDDVLAALRAYDWPGNVRELENTIERAVVMSRGSRLSVDEISMSGVSATSTPKLPSLDLKKNVAWAERESVRRALQLSGGVKKRAAEGLGISQRALSYYLSKYDID